MRLLWCEEHDPKETDTTTSACHLGLELGDAHHCRMVEALLLENVEAEKRVNRAVAKAVGDLRFKAMPEEIERITAAVIAALGERK